MAIRIWVTALLLASASALAAAPLPEKFGDTRVVILDTSAGKIKIRLFPEKAPLTVANFLAYVDDGFYEDTLFHRVIPGFVIQGGGHDRKMQEKQGRAPVRNESGNGLNNLRGTLAAARRADPDSAQSQFFINLKDNAFLDAARGRPGYCVFGEVIEGMDVVDRIAGVPTGARGVLQGVPLQDVVIRSITRGAE